MGKAREIADKFYGVTDKKDVRGLAQLVDPDVSFIGPLMRTSGAEGYVALNEQLLPFHLKTRLLKQFEAGEDVCSIYEMDLRTPAGEVLTLEVADWIQVRDGRIRQQRIYYDPRDFAKAFGM